MRTQLITLALGLLCFTAKASTTYPAGSPVAVNGRLSVCGTQMCNEGAAPIQLRGVSSHGLQWFGQYMNRKAIGWMASDWGTDVVRAAMYTAEGGYADGSDDTRRQLEERIDTMVAATEAAGVYLIIDWHILSDNNPQTNQTKAIAFFQKMAAKYKDKSHILYEICNEPNGSTTWAQIRSYASAVIPAIRAIDPQAIVIVGTPTWSQDLDLAAKDPLIGGNLMYTLHFYAGWHGQSLRDKAQAAIDKGLAIFATEWGTTDASGDGKVDSASSDVWLDFLKDRKISWCNWSISDKGESSAALRSGAGVDGNWAASALTPSGRYVRRKMLEPADDFPAGKGPFLLRLQTNGGLIVASPIKDAYDKGEVVQLIARTPTDYRFLDWSGAASGTDTIAQVVMDGNRVVQANFQYIGPVALTLSPNGCGTIESSASGSSFAQGQSVTLTARPDPGCSFLGWTGGVSGSTNPLSMTMRTDSSIGADFLPDSGGPNLVKNGNFDDGLSTWNMGWNGSASGNVAIEDGQYKASITAGGSQVWHVQLTQGALPLVKGRSYELSFVAKASNARTVYPNVGMDGGKYPSYSNGDTLALGTSFARYRIPFAMDSASDANARLEFDLGLDTPSVWIDSIVLRQVITTHVNHAPTVAQSLPDIQVPEDGTVPNIDLTKAFADRDGDSLTISVTHSVASPATLALSGKVIALALAPDAYGKDTVVVSATDPSGLAVADTFLVEVASVNDIPTVRDTAASSLQETADTVVLQASDKDGQIASFAIAQSPKYGIASIVANAVVFLPADGFFGKDTMFFQVIDDSGAHSASARVVFDVAHVNHAPTVAQSLPGIQVPEDGTVPNIDLTKAFADRDGDSLTISVTHSVASPATLAVSGKTIALALTPDAYGKDTVVVSATDPSGLAVADTFLIEVASVNDIPTVRDTAVSTTQGKTVRIELEATDRDGRIAAFAISRRPRHGLATLVGSTLSFDADAGFHGDDTLEFTATDDSAAASVPRRIVCTVLARPIPTSIAQIDRKATTRGLDLDVPASRPTIRHDIGNGSLGSDLRDCSQETSCQAVALRLGSPTRVSVSIHDNLGTLVNSWERTVTSRELLRLPAAADGRRLLEIRWNLRSAAGRNVPTGVYLWKIEARADDGETLETVRKLGVYPEVR